MWANPQEMVTLVTFTEEVLNGKLHFLCSASLSMKPTLTKWGSLSNIKINKKSSLGWQNYFWEEQRDLLYVNALPDSK